MTVDNGLPRGGRAPTSEGKTELARWMSSVLPDSAPPYTYELIAGGHSNLTYSVMDSQGSTWVLRRPPFGHLLPTAHDMSREFRILSALGPTELPVPPVVALCNDTSVTDVPFYVMEMVDGLVVRDESTSLTAFDEAGRRRLGFAVADTLAAIHAISPAAVGLDDLGRPGNYVVRQLQRWKRQLDQSKTRELPALDRVLHQLEARVPTEGSTGLVHGDFRLDNCIVGADAEVRAVLDWELCTVGEPLADLGLLLVYWTQVGEHLRVTATAPTAAPGFPLREEMLTRYAEVSGRSLPNMDYYVAFAYWRLACISEGVLARYLHGGMGERDAGSEPFEDRVLDLIEGAERITRAW